MRLRPVRPAPTISAFRAVPSRECLPIRSVRSAKREATIATMQISASITKNERLKSRMSWVSTMNESATSSETTTAAAAAIASRTPAYRQTER